MREWNLKASQLPSFLLAADARFGRTNFCDDHIWELNFRGGEPAAITLQTTFGLRVRGFRIFPRFFHQDQLVQDPAEFAAPIVIRKFFPNFIQFTFSPFPDIDVLAEVWVPSSQTAALRMEVSNRRETAVSLRIEMAALLQPVEDGKPVSVQEIQAAMVLSGHSEDLYPLVFTPSGAVGVPGAHPSLACPLELPAGARRSLIWSEAALSSPEASLELARQTAARPWEAERSRIELVNAGQVEVFTGDALWDFAFSYAQTAAHRLLVGPAEGLPFPSFVQARLPDQGFSLRGDGQDYGQLWNGQTPAESLLLAENLLPASVEVVKGILRNFLATQTESGAIDWKPGLAGQRANRLATPLLVSLAWKIYQHSGDQDFLREVFPKLSSFLQAWFSSEQDRDGDGIPEWMHVMQSAYEDHPLFSRWVAHSQGIEISTAESPALCACLYREIQTLFRIGELIGREDGRAFLEPLAANLRQAVLASYDEQKNSYQYWDRDSHFTSTRQLVHSQFGAGEIPVQQSFDQPQRLVIRFQTVNQSTRRPQIFIHGVSPSGQHRLERISADRIFWLFGNGTATSERTYLAIEHLEVQGIEAHDQLSIHTTGLDGLDLTLLAPLWAEIPAADQAQAIAQANLQPGVFVGPYGLLASPENQSGQPALVDDHLLIFWNSLVLQGLLAYDMRQQAAEIFARLMETFRLNLETYGYLRRSYSAVTGHGSGERDALAGLPPTGLFLDILGVQILSPHQVRLSGNNPFPWPITVKYRGLTIFRQKDKTQVIFPDGQTATIEDPSPQLVSLE